MSQHNSGMKPAHSVVIKNAAAVWPEGKLNRSGAAIKFRTPASTS
jgi:hypothetical protein